MSPGKTDLQSVILHEFGHTLNLGHFGILQAFTTNGVTTLVYRPVNTINAFHIGQPRDCHGPNDKVTTAKHRVVDRGIRMNFK